MEKGEWKSDWWGLRRGDIERGFKREQALSCKMKKVWGSNV